MLTKELEFDLPRELIATHPVRPRDSARLLVVSRSDSTRLEHRTVRDLPGLLDSGDTLVFNSTRVLPARFTARNLDTGGKAQGLYLRDGEPDSAGQRTWECLLKARRFAPGRRLEIHSPGGVPTGVVLELIERTNDEQGAWRVAVDSSEPTPVLLDRVGLTPLPPYILGARRDQSDAGDDAADRLDYQTVFAAADQAGSVAAPTAGLHFTPGLLGEIDGRGVKRAQVVLHVGAGTFQPIEAERVEDHPMHAEWCSMGESGPAVLDAPGRVIAVGTTSARTIESFADPAIAATAGGDPWLSTRLLISPGYRWRCVDGLVTNFHLPHSTLLAMVAALLPGGIEQLMRVYAEAIEQRYRFFSFGDAMLVLP